MFTTSPGTLLKKKTLNTNQALVLPRSGAGPAIVPGSATNRDLYVANEICLQILSHRSVYRLCAYHTHADAFGTFTITSV